MIEDKGIPTVTFITQPFSRLAAARSNALGVDALPWIELQHPMATRGADEIARLAEANYPAVVAALTETKRVSDHDGQPADAAHPSSKRAALVSVSGAPAAVQDYIAAAGWTDGLPVIAPTPDLVATMLAANKLDADVELCRVAPSFAVATAEKVAINAVMAGCKPEYLPVVIAALKALTDAAFNLAGIQATTHPVGPLLMVNGPVRHAIGLNCGSNVFGQGCRPNASIGRAVRFVMSNIGGATPGKTDMATHGTPCKFTFCGGENEEESPWPGFQYDRGYTANDSLVTAFAAEAPHNVNDHGSRSGREVLFALADTINIVGCNNVHLGGEIFVILGPEHAQMLANDGMSKGDVAQALFERMPLSLDRISPSNLERYRTIRPAFDTPPDVSEISFLDSADQLLIFVAGGAGKHSLVVPGFGSSRYVTAKVYP